MRGEGGGEVGIGGVYGIMENESPKKVSFVWFFSWVDLGLGLGSV